MKSSKYNFFFDHSKSIYVYNIFSGGILQIDESIQNSLICNKFDDLSIEIKEILIENCFVVENDLNETNAYLYFYEYSRYLIAPKTLNLTIIPTYKCNLKCTYCFQNNIDRKRDLKKIDLEKIVKFAEKQIIKSSPQSLRIDFYGGEPLLKKQLCIDLANNLSEVAKKHNILFETQITTNGILLDDEVFEKLIKPHNMSIQLTIDGLKETHDSKRIFKNGVGTFDIINFTIDRIINGGLEENISLRINLDKENISEAQNVLSLYKDRISFIYFSYLSLPINHKTKKYSTDKRNNLCISREECLHDYHFKISEILKRNGIKHTSENFGKKGPCYLNCENRFFIEPDLSVYKCDMLLSIKEHCVGKINENGDFLIEPAYFNQMLRSPSYYENCKNCQFLPGCGSGCAGYAFLNNGSIHKPFCDLNRELLLSSLKNYIKINE